MTVVSIILGLTTHIDFFLETLLNQPDIRLHLPFSDWFGSKQMSLWIQINRKMVNTIWFRVDLIGFRKYFSVCKFLTANHTLDICIIVGLKNKDLLKGFSKPKIQTFRVLHTEKALTVSYFIFRIFWLIERNEFSKPWKQPCADFSPWDTSPSKFFFSFG